MSEWLEYLLTGIALLLILEGIIPFISPQQWRAMIRHFMMFSDSQLRAGGMTFMLVGVLILFLIHHF